MLGGAGGVIMSSNDWAEHKEWYRCCMPDRYREVRLCWGVMTECAGQDIDLEIGRAVYSALGHRVGRVVDIRPSMYVESGRAGTLTVVYILFSNGYRYTQSLSSIAYAYARGDLIPVEVLSNPGGPVDRELLFNPYPLFYSESDGGELAAEN